MNRRGHLLALASLALAACGGGGGGAAPFILPAASREPDPQPQPAQQTPVTKKKIVFYGDSIAWGLDGADPERKRQSPNNIPAIVASVLGDLATVENQAQGGSLTPQWLWGPAAAEPHAAIPINWATRMSQSDADIVVINTGVTDAFIPGYTETDHAYSYAQMDSLARQYGKLFVIMTPNPIDDPHNTGLWGLMNALRVNLPTVPRIEQFDTIAAALPGLYGAHVPDKIHPDDSLYAFMGYVAALRLGSLLT